MDSLDKLDQKQTFAQITELFRLWHTAGKGTSIENSIAQALSDSLVNLSKEINPRRIEITPRTEPVKLDDLTFGVDNTFPTPKRATMLPEPVENEYEIPLNENKLLKAVRCHFHKSGNIGVVPEPFMVSRGKVHQVVLKYSLAGAERSFTAPIKEGQTPRDACKVLATKFNRLAKEVVEGAA